jgi:hypothetical protein
MRMDAWRSRGISFSVVATRSAAAIVIMMIGMFGADWAGAHAADGHPARLQDGSCGNLGAVAFRLNGVGATVTAEGTPIPPPERVGAAAAFPADVSLTILDKLFTDVVKGEHAIVVYESDEAMDHVIACGDVAGVMTRQMAGMTMPGDQVVFGLGDAIGSGLAGFGVIESIEGGKTMVAIFLGEGGAGTPAAAATPAS